MKKSQAKSNNKAFKNAQRRATETKGIGAARSVHGPVPPIELYQRENCPHSHAVRNRLTRLGLDFVAHTVPEGNALKHDQLIQAGGKDEVPFLIDHSSGVKLYKSNAIIAYLENEYGEPNPSLLGRIAKGLDTQVRSRADQIAWTLQAPILRVQEFRTDVQSAFDTVRSSIEFLRGRLEQASRAKRPATTQGSAASKPRAQPPRAVRANVASVTEAA